MEGQEQVALPVYLLDHDTVSEGGLGHQPVSESQAHSSPSPHSCGPVDSTLGSSYPKALPPPTGPPLLAIACELDNWVFKT